MKIPIKHQKVIKHFLECFWLKKTKIRCMHCSDCIVFSINLLKLRAKTFQDSVYSPERLISDNTIRKFVISMCNKVYLPCDRAIEIEPFVMWLLTLKDEQLDYVRSYFPAHVEFIDMALPNLVFKNPIECNEKK